MPKFAAIQDLIARRDPAVALHGASLALVAVLGVQAARLGWALIAPIGPIGAVPPAADAPAAAADFSILDRFDPFHRVAAGTPAADVSATGFRLFGVRVGRESSAIIGRSDGKQVSVAVGEELAPGVTLQAVAADHVELMVQGRPARLAFQAVASGSVPYQPPMPVAAAAAAPAGAIVTPTAANVAELARAGLQPGDIVISVNGESVADPASVEALGRDLAGGGEAVVQFKRNGEFRTATLRIPAQ